MISLMGSHRLSVRLSPWTSGDTLKLLPPRLSLSLSLAPPSQYSHVGWCRGRALG